MKIIIKGTNITLTAPIKSYVEGKIDGLEKFVGNIQKVNIELELTSKHHQNGENLFRAEANMTLPKHFFRAESFGDDMYATIDKLRDELKMELRKFKDKKISKKRRQLSSEL